MMATYGSPVQFSSEETAREWFRMIEDGVPEDVAWTRLDQEATSSKAPSQYRSNWNSIKNSVVTDTVGLTRAEYVVIRMYTSDQFKFYKLFNADCRQRKWDLYVVFTSLLHSGIMKLRGRLSDSVKNLYRGLNCDGFDETTSDDEGVYMSGFTSTSNTPEVARKFGSKLMRVSSRTCSSISGVSCFPQESEWLFSPFQGFVQQKTGSGVIFKTNIERTIPFLSFPLFRGAMLGAVVGNSIGSAYEFQPTKTIQDILKNICALESQSEANRGKCRYTSDTCMTLGLADSLTRAKGVDIKDLAKSFSDIYAQDPCRNYGGNVARILQQFRKIPPDGDLFGPALCSDSFGNGGAMRIAPAALLYWNPSVTLNENVRQITRLTHSNDKAIIGALLQANAIQVALIMSTHENRTGNVEKQFLDKLISKIESLDSVSDKQPYLDKLSKIQEYFPSHPKQQTVLTELGNGISACDSVPTAIYCFLRGMKEIPEIPPDRTAFERTIIYAISLGGDTDTIASMAGAIAGAYYGQDSITHRWRNLCETKAIEDAKRYAKVIFSQLYEE